jgi:hypothetical protein
LSVDADNENWPEIESSRIILEENAEDYVQWGGEYHYCKVILQLREDCRKKARTSTSLFGGNLLITYVSQTLQLRIVADHQSIYIIVEK